MVIVCNIVKWEMILNFKCTRKLKTIVTKKKITLQMGKL